MSDKESQREDLTISKHKNSTENEVWIKHEYARLKCSKGFWYLFVSITLNQLLVNFTFTNFKVFGEKKYEDTFLSIYGSLLP